MAQANSQSTPHRAFLAALTSLALPTRLYWARRSLGPEASDPIFAAIEVHGESQIGGTKQSRRSAPLRIATRQKSAMFGIATRRHRLRY